MSSFLSSPRILLSIRWRAIFCAVRFLAAVRRGFRLSRQLLAGYLSQLGPLCCFVRAFQSCGFIERKERKSINPSNATTPSEWLSIVVMCLGGYTAFEAFGAQLPAAGIVAESDSEIVASADGVVYFPTAGRCDYRVDSPRRKIAYQSRMVERYVGEHAERENGRRNRQRHRNDHRYSLTAVEQPEGLREIAPFQSHHKVDNRTTRTQPEVIP